MKRFYLGLLFAATSLLLVAAQPAASAGNAESTKEFLSSILKAVSAVDSVRYGLVMRTYVPGDSFYISEKKSEYVECKNPADTSLLAKYVARDEGKKMFSRAYFGDSVYYCQKAGYITRSDGISFGFKTVSPPFFNHATSILDYFLTSDRDIKISITDCGDNWLVSGDIPCDVARICFYGKPREMMSFPYPECVYELLINKTDSLPRRISYQSGNPPFLEVQEINNIEFGDLSPDEFSIDKINVDGAPCFDSENDGREIWKRYEAIKQLRHGLASKPAPDFELIEVGGDTLRLADYRDKVLLLLVTSATCPHARQIMPVLDKISADYASAGVRVLGVYSEPTMQTGALSNLKERYKISFPVAIDRQSSVVDTYFTGGLTPVLYIIDRTGTMHCSVGGASPVEGVYDRDVRKIIDEVLAK